MKKFLIATAALVSLASAANAGALNQLVHSVETNRGETCQRFGDNIAFCSLMKNPDYKSLFIALPDYDRATLKTPMGRLGANSAAAKSCETIMKENYFVTRGYRTEVFASSVLPDGDVVIVNCAYRRFEKVK